MLLHKWCSFLMRMVSPLRVGLIWFCLIGVSSLSFHHPQNHSLHRTTTDVVILKKNAIYPSYAKGYSFNRTKVSTVSPRSSFRVPVSSRPIFNNGSNTDSETRSKRLPKLNLNFKLKVTNGSEENSTIVYLPRLSRAMTNFSKNSVNNNLQPIIVSSHRRILLDPKEYTIRTESNPGYSQNLNTSSQFGMKFRRKVSQNATNLNPWKFGLKRRRASPKTNRTTARPDLRRIFKTTNIRSQPYAKSSVIVNVKGDSENTKTNSSTLLFLTATSPKNEYNRRFSRFNKRQGRNFDLTNSDSKESAGESSEEFIYLFNKTISAPSKINSELRKKSLLFTHAVPTTSNKSSSSQEETSSSEKYGEKLLSDLGFSYSVKKANNLTIYEILKPRLKSNTTVPEIIDFSPDQNSFSLQNDAAFHQIKDSEENLNPLSANSSFVDNELYNSTVLANNTDNNTPERANSMIIIPSRSDSSFGIKYVMVNRKNFAVYPAYPNDSNLVMDSTPVSDDFSDPAITKQSSTYLRRNNHTESTISENLTTDKDISVGEDEINKIIDLLINTNRTSKTNSSGENLSADSSEYMTLLYESDSIRQPKMTEKINSNNTPFKNPKIDSKMFYDYFAKKPPGNTTLREFPYPEFRPGNMFRYSDIYQRRPILDAAYPRPTPIAKLAKTETRAVTEETVMNPTTFNSLRTSVRVLSTYYPNRMQDVTMKFGNRIEATTLPSGDRRPDYRNEDDPDDAEYRDAIDPGFTMEKLAYLLIGTCCGLSILCLFVVVIAIKCRRAIVEKRLKSQFRKRLYHHERMSGMTGPWQQQMFDHFMYLNRRPGDSSCSSNTDSCNCRCVTWSLGPRNLDATRPLCPTSRSSLYLYGQKKLPFGAASTLRFESMLGRKRSPENNHQHKAESPQTDSSHENDSLDIDSDSREGDGPKQCTCIDYNVWSMPPSNVPRGFFTLCPNPRRYNAGNCSQHPPPPELRTIARDLPPPVTGSNYLDRSEGVVYWSSNDERLI